MTVQGHRVYWTASKKARMSSIVHCNCATAVNVCCCILGDRRPTLLKHRGEDESVLRKLFIQASTKFF
ncbi:hypothetical protein GQ457_02G028680 [Hibiscus cannabinus]